MILTIVIGVVALSVLIIVHELGHFIAAKATGVPVEEFGIGFPPRAYGRKWRGTIYSINWIPFGGFNKIAGEVDPAVPRGLASRSYGVRLLVLGGGIVMSLLLPFVLLSLAYMVPHDIVSGQVVIEDVSPNSPADIAGILPGDAIISVNDNPLRNASELSRYVQLNLGKEMTLSLEHADATIETVSLTPRWQPPEGEGSMGVIDIQTEDAVIISESYPPWEAIPIGARSCIEALVLYKNGIFGMILGTIPFTPAGPVGIVQIAGAAAQSGVSPVLELTAFISIAIAITQLIPFPALDGGRMLFVLLEWIRRGKRVSPRTEGIVHSIGFMVLLALLVLITYQDIFRWISGESLI
ncbi:MAG: site-2 protease family protein [Dehalococcoidales bacterium]|nr:site-2 protease family protein [Dehalococcoidales bacterium]